MATRGHTGDKELRKKGKQNDETTAEALILALERGDLDWRAYGTPEF